MSVGWERLPLLALHRVLEHLELPDAVATMSTCRHWRNAMFFFEGHKDLIKLRVTLTDKNLFLARVFRKHVRRLHVLIDSDEGELDKFFHIILPEFYDAVKLNEILFIGPSYLQQNYNLPAAKLKRVIIESLVYKNSHHMFRLGMFGCEIDSANDNDRYMHEKIKYYSAPLTYSDVTSRADQILSSSNTDLMVFSTLQHISVDYNQINTEALETLSHLPVFDHLALTVCNKRHSPLEPLNWNRLAQCYPNGLNVSINIISVSLRTLNSVVANVLIPGMALVSLKVLYCKTVYGALVTHVARYFKATLRELVWADCPYEAIEHSNRIVRNVTQAVTDSCINPFVLICWQCIHLRRLVIHGYWIWHYDILGYVRLRKTLRELEISSIYSKQSRSLLKNALPPDSVLRVLVGDAPRTLHPAALQRVNELTEFEWKPCTAPHPGLRPRASAAARALYVQLECAARICE